MLTVKKYALGLLNPVKHAEVKYPSLLREIRKLIQAVTEEGKFSNANHLLVIREERHYRQKNWDDVKNSKLF